MDTITDIYRTFKDDENRIEQNDFEIITRVVSNFNPELLAPEPLMKYPQPHKHTILTVASKEVAQLWQTQLDTVNQCYREIYECLMDQLATARKPFDASYRETLKISG